MSAYVMIINSKVREHLMVQAKLRLPASFSDAMRKDRVEDVIKQMMLESSQASLIGVPGIVKGISATNVWLIQLFDGHDVICSDFKCYL
uniref:Peptide deformylase n=1 Tax=Heterorhabditis bacteriophora TaxID=37862 RepID=A0A1I7X0N8_HETBA